jgi:hypothetical protein
MTAIPYEEFKKLPPEGKTQYWADHPEDIEPFNTERLRRIQAGEIEQPLPPGGYGDTGQAAAAGYGQGFTYNTSDEMAGGVNAVGDGTYQTGVDAARARQADLQARHPWAYGIGEGAGIVSSVVNPLTGWAAGPLRAAQGGSLLARGAASLARGALVGGSMAGASAAGEAEGGAGPRVMAGLNAVPMGAAIGVGVEIGLLPFIRMVAKRFGISSARSVETNLRKVAEAEGLTADEVADRILRNGEVFAGMNETTRVTARSIKDKSSAAGSHMVGETEKRLAEKQGAALDAVETSLTGQPPTPSLHRQAAEQLERQRREAGTTFGTTRNAADAGDPANLSLAIVDAVERLPSLMTDLNQLYRISKTAPLFDDAGRFLREPTIADAEFLTRAVKEAGARMAAATDSTGSKLAAGELRDVSDNLRAVVNGQAPQLIAPRSAVRGAIEAEKTGFPLGLDKTLTARPGVFNEAYRVLTPEGQQGARLGAATAIGAESTNRARPNVLIDKLLESKLAGAADDLPGMERWPAQNVRTMIGDDAKNAINPLLEGAKGEQVLLDRLTGGSNTAPRLAALEALATRQTGSGNVVDAAAQLAQGGGFGAPVLQGLRMVLGSATELTEGQLMQFAELMMSRDPELMRRALGGSKTAMGKLRAAGRDFTTAVGERALGRRGAQAAGHVADPYLPSNVLGLDLDHIFGGVP